MGIRISPCIFPFFQKGYRRKLIFFFLDLFLIGDLVFYFIYPLTDLFRGGLWIFSAFFFFFFCRLFLCYGDLLQILDQMVASVDRKRFFRNKRQFFLRFLCGNSSRFFFLDSWSFFSPGNQFFFLFSSSCPRIFILFLRCSFPAVSPLLFQFFLLFLFFPLKSCRFSSLLLPPCR